MLSKCAVAVQYHSLRRSLEKLWRKVSVSKSFVSMDYHASLFVIAKLLILSVVGGQNWNDKAIHVTCSGDAKVPSSLVISGKVHPLNGMLIISPNCDGGDDRFEAAYPLPINMPIWYDGNTTERCVFIGKKKPYYITIDVLTTNNTQLTTKTITCDMPMSATAPLNETVPDYKLDKTIDIQDYVWQRCGPVSNKIEFIPQPYNIIALLSCKKNQQSRVIITTTPVERQLYNSGNETSKCVFDTGSVSVSFFKAGDFSYLGSSSMTYCKPRTDKKILKVIPHCGNAVGDPAWIKGVADVDADFRAVCKGGQTFIFNNTDDDDVNYKLDVFYSGDEKSSCVFNRREKSSVYVILVKVSWGEKGAVVHKHTREYQVTCTFDAAGSDESADQEVDDTLIAPDVLQNYQAGDSTSSVILHLMDVLDRPVHLLPLGRMIRLRAMSNGQVGESGGIRPVGCDAVGVNSGQRFAIIRAGCGDGIVFMKNVGFESSGLNSTSPYFKIFNMHDDPVIKFECNFTMCASNCDGDSCTDQKGLAGAMVARRKRHSRDTVYLQYFLGQTEEIKTIG